MHIGSKGKPAECFVCITRIIEAVSSIRATVIIMQLAKLSKAILTTLSSDDEDDQSSISSKDSDKKPAQKKKK